MSHTKKVIAYGRHQLIIETGEIARQAQGAVMVSMDDTVVLVTAVGMKEVRQGQDFLPLTVDYQERTYAAGKIPGGFFKREGRPSEKETLTSRLIDRPIRPLFPEGFFNEVQIVATVVSSNPEVDSDIPAMIGASAALALSGIPFNGPIAAARVGYLNGEYVLNPTATELKTSQLNLVVAGTSEAVLMVESEAMELPEEVMLGAVVHGHQQMQTVINAINDLADEAGKPLWDWTPPKSRRSFARGSPSWPRRICGSPTRSSRSRHAAEKWTRFASAFSLRSSPTLPRRRPQTPQRGFSAISRRRSFVARSSTVSLASMAATRAPFVPISIRTGVLPRAHGSALFTRGETQALVTATLGTSRDEQIIDALQGEYTERFMLHYNMPPYATGETGRVGSPKRREIGHGRLAKRALIAVLPTAGGIRLLVPRGLRDYGIERLQFDGERLWRMSVADGCRRATEGPRRRYRDGSYQGRQSICRVDRHPR